VQTAEIRENRKNTEFRLVHIESPIIFVELSAIKLCRDSPASIGQTYCTSDVMLAPKLSCKLVVSTLFHSLAWYT
jgi:hypothetical protein